MTIVALSAVLTACEPRPRSTVARERAAPAADAGRYEVALRNADGTAVRWNPCEPIRYVTNLAGGPRFARAEFDDAVAAIRSASGLDFRWAGDTAERPSANRPSVDQRDRSRPRPILLAFATEDQLAFGRPAASAWGHASTATDSHGRLRYVSGQVVIRPDHDWTAGSRSVNPLALMMQHELGHVVGLAHVPVSTEVMGVGGNGSVRSWGPGDTRGLRALGRAAGCLPAG